jgi:predicted hotdog family 3-hydroxylacyl-ACP dehydratase
VTTPGARRVSTSRFPPVAEVLPHAGRMVLLSGVLAHTETATMCAAQIDRDTMFADADGGVPAWVALEYMAQCIAAHGGLRARAAGDPVVPGVLLGTRSLVLHVPRFTAGQRLRITATHVWGEHDFFSFACTVRDEATDTMLVEATLTVARMSGEDTAVVPSVSGTEPDRPARPT